MLHRIDYNAIGSLIWVAPKSEEEYANACFAMRHAIAVDFLRFLGKRKEEKEKAAVGLICPRRISNSVTIESVVQGT